MVEDKFLSLINTPEFQRLRRIKQLSVADFAFPSADHTRFSHSIGTFYVMKKIISHLEIEFKELEIDIKEEEKDLALVSALVHDIGHGPFSHAFEHLIPDNQKSHEKWTIEIITSDKTLINKKLISEFGEKFPEKVANLIDKKFGEEGGKLNLFSLLSSLISSQIDADRLDYLVRDSYNTGTKFGNIDIDRIISSFKITVHNNQYSIYIPQKYLADIEEYLFSRYQMNKSVYFHPIKVEYEEMIRLIFKRAFMLFKERSLKISNELLKRTFENELSIEDYCSLDESLFLWNFQEWKNSKDKILSLLCECYLNRKKFKNLKVLNNTEKEINHFKKDIIRALGEDYSEDFFDDKFYFIEKKCEYSMYKTKKENIKFLNKFKKLEDFSEISKIFNSSKGNIILENKYKLIYMNLDILGETHSTESIKKVSKVIDSYNLRNHIEIENKYFINDNKYFGKVKQFIKDLEEVKIIEESNKKLQTDIYFDTVDFDFNKKEEALRVRKKDEEYMLALKIPVSNIEKGEILKGQYERYESEIEVNGFEVSNSIDFINEKSSLKSISSDEINKIIKIENNREKMKLFYKGTKLELAFDDFKIIDINIDAELENKFQIEIELLSEYPHKVKLLELCKLLESKFGDKLEKATESKLQLGLKKLR